MGFVDLYKMFSLFCEAKFWTLKNDIQIRNTDFGVLRYYDKKEIDGCLYLEGKKSFSNQRGSIFILKNKRPSKLKDNLKELEQQLSTNKVVFYEWRNDNILYLVLNTGLIVIIGVNAYTKDIYKITFDRFLIGKILSENICDVLSTKTHLIISYNENQLTIISYAKPSSDFNHPQKLGKMEPKIQLVDLCGTSGRKLGRRLSSNVSGDVILTWWYSSKIELHPWSPLVKDEDRANVHIYSILGTKIELLCFYKAEFDLVNVRFSLIKPNLLFIIEQKISKKGEITIEYSMHEVVKKSLKRISITSIPLQSQICCHAISPDEDKLIIGCLDASLVLFDEPKGITRLVKTAFIPNTVLWHYDGALIVVANERSQFQFFDAALSCLRTQILSEDITSSNILDLSSYFITQPSLISMKWNKKSIASCHIDRYIYNDGLLLLIFDGGPLVILTLIGGGGLLNDIQNCGLTTDAIIRQYLLWNQSDKALNLLLSLNWNTNGSTCLTGLYHIANFIFRHPFTPEKEIQLEAALGSFYSPIRPLNRSTENEFGNQVHDLSRRFFHHLLRYKLYEKAYCLAIDLGNADLFVDLYHCAKILKDKEMAFACSSKVEEFSCISENSSHSGCSNESCSCSERYTGEEYDDENAILPPLPQVSVKKSQASKVPPLPNLNHNDNFKSTSFFNCNSVFLQPEPILEETEENKYNLSSNFQTEPTLASFNTLQPTYLRNQSSESLDNNYTGTQILTPEFPHSYEIRTSFSEEERISNNFAFTEPFGKYIHFGNPKNQSYFSNSALNGINSTLDISASSNFIPGKKDFIRNNNREIFTNSLVNDNKVALNLKSSQLQNPKQFCQIHSNNPTSNFNISKMNSMDYLVGIPSMPKTFQNANKPSGRMTANLNPPPLNYYPSKTDVKLNPCGPSKNSFDGNNFTFQKPLHFVPNGQPKNFTKHSNNMGAKQKVKFSDTVTQIIMPDISKISIDDKSFSKQQDAKKEKNSNFPKLSNPSSTKYSQVPENKLRESQYSTQQDQNDEYENNERIKVIHFGVV